MTHGNIEDPVSDPVRSWAASAIERGRVAWPGLAVAQTS
jgi:hypothetical protein